MEKEQKKTIKFQLVTLKATVEFEIEEGDYHNILIGSNPNPPLQIAVIENGVVRIIVNPYKFPGYKGDVVVEGEVE